MTTIGLVGCGGVRLGPDPEAPRSDLAEETGPPQYGEKDWPDDTLPLVTVELQRPPEAATSGDEAPESPEANTADVPAESAGGAGSAP